jgi:hypothetical protein
MALRQFQPFLIVLPLINVGSPPIVSPPSSVDICLSTHPHDMSLSSSPPSCLLISDLFPSKLLGNMPYTLPGVKHVYLSTSIHMAPSYLIILSHSTMCLTPLITYTSAPSTIHLSPGAPCCFHSMSCPYPVIFLI